MNVYKSLSSTLGALLAVVAIGSSRPAAADNISLLSLQTGHSIVIPANGLTRVAVGDGRIAGVVPIGTTQLVVNGKAPGHTTIFVWNGVDRKTYEVTVTEQSFDDIAKLLRSAINEPSVQVVAFNSNLVVRGRVVDVAAFNRLSDVIDRFKGIKFASGSGNGAVVNAVTIGKPLGMLQDEIASIKGGHGVRVDTDKTGNVVVSGTVHDAAEEQQVLAKVRGLSGPYLSSDGKVVDRLGLETTSQVDVKVYVLEVDKSAQSQLGLRLQTATLGSIGSGSQTFNISTQPSVVGVENPGKATNPNNPFNFGPFQRISLLAPTLDLLMSEGHARLLSTPNLVTFPGQEATFLVGGEIPIPVSNGLGSVSIIYKEYGVRLKVTPTILANGAVEAKINPEISELDFASGINLNGFVVPGLKTSKLSTDVITQSGESIVMGGLLKHLEQKNIIKIPLLGDIPILGQLFRSTSYQKQDTDVVFVMTPIVITK